MITVVDCLFLTLRQVSLRIKYCEHGDTLDSVCAFYFSMDYHLPSSGQRDRYPSARGPVMPPVFPVRCGISLFPSVNRTFRDSDRPRDAIVRLALLHKCGKTLGRFLRRSD
jgi:hypothetical protein